MKQPNRWHLATALLLTAVFAFELYRAITQSITIDEARLYLDYIRPEPPVFWHQYDAGHHVLQTYLSWLLAKRFGWSEIVLRIPSLVGCAAYLWFAFRFSKRVAAGAGCVAVALLLCANPLILDAFVMARGYGLALGLYACALLLSMEDRLPPAGVLAGLSVAANLIFLVPVAALFLTVSLLQMRAGRRSLYALISDYAGPAVVVCGVLVMLPFTYLRPDFFYTGASGVLDAIAGTTKHTFARADWASAAGMWIGYAVQAALAATIAFGFARASRDETFVVPAATVAITLAAAIVQHWGGFPYPTARTAIAILFLFAAAAAAAPVHKSLALIAGLILVMQNDPRTFGEWRFDSRTKEAVRQIRRRQPNGKYTVSAHNDYAWTLNYYRLRQRLANMDEVKTGGPQPGADFYLLHTADDRAVADFHLQVIWRDPLCQCELAVPAATNTRADARRQMLR